jgi:hypothetical protein
LNFSAEKMTTNYLKFYETLVRNKQIKAKAGPEYSNIKGFEELIRKMRTQNPVELTWWTKVCEHN